MSKQQELSVVLASPPDRNSLVAQINWGWEQFAELNQERGELQLEVYSPVSGDAWYLPYEAVISALKKAEGLLAGRTSDSGLKDTK